MIGKLGVIGACFGPDFGWGLLPERVISIIMLILLVGFRLRKLLADLLIDPADCRPVIQLVRLARIGVAAERSLLRNCAKGAIFNTVDRRCQSCPARDFCRQRY